MGKSKGKTIGFYATEEQLKQLSKLSKKLRLDTSKTIRLAIWRLYEIYIEKTQIPDKHMIVSSDDPELLKILEINHTLLKMLIRACRGGEAIDDKFVEALADIDSTMDKITEEEFQKYLSSSEK